MAKPIKSDDRKTLSWIFSKSKKQIIPMVFLIISSAIYASTATWFALSSKGIVDGAEAHNKDKLIQYSVYMLLVICVQIGLNLINRNVEERIKGKLEISFKSSLLSQILKKDFSKITSYHSGELQIRLFNDVNVITDGVVSILPNLVGMLTRLICAFSVLVVLDKIFALAFLIGGIAMFIVARCFSGKLKGLHKRVQETDGKTRSFMQEAIESLLVVKAFSSEEKINSKADQLQQDNFKIKMIRRTFGICANAAFAFVFQIGYLFALIWGGYKIYLSLFTFGDLTAILQLVNQVQAPFTSLSGLLPKYYNVLASAERIIEIENIKDEETAQLSSYNSAELYSKMNSINFDNITFSYGRDTVLDNTSLSINKSDFVAIMGISGIGKSTLLKLLLGVFNNYNGEIYINTNDEKIVADKSTRKLFSYVPQGNMLLSGTIRENITFINDKATDDEINNAIKISCADDFINDLPKGLETVIGEKGMGLSEGQVQRLAIARSILSGAPILLLDEATSALDENTEYRFLQNLKNLNDVTCIIISHKRAALDICNKHVQIIDKKIVVEEKK